MMELGVKVYRKVKFMKEKRRQDCARKLSNHNANLSKVYDNASGRWITKLAC